MARLELLLQWRRAAKPKQRNSVRWNFDRKDRPTWPEDLTFKVTHRRRLLRATENLTSRIQALSKTRPCLCKESHSVLTVYRQCRRSWRNLVLLITRSLPHKESIVWSSSKLWLGVLRNPWLAHLRRASSKGILAQKIDRCQMWFHPPILRFWSGKHLWP